MKVQGRKLIRGFVISVGLMIALSVGMFMLGKAGTGMAAGETSLGLQTPSPTMSPTPRRRGSPMPSPSPSPTGSPEPSPTVSPSPSPSPRN